MKVLRVLIMLATFGMCSAILAASYGLISRSTAPLFSALLTLHFIRLILEWRFRNDRQYRDPTPAQSMRNVIMATGLVAAIVIARSARVASDYLVPVFIALVSLALAFLASRFASKHADSIGEARFDTRSNMS